MEIRRTHVHKWKLGELNVHLLVAMVWLVSVKPVIVVFSWQVTQVFEGYKYDKGDHQSTGHTQRIFTLKYHPDHNDVFITGGWDNVLKVNSTCIGSKSLMVMAVKSAQLTQGKTLLVNWQNSPRLSTCHAQHLLAARLLWCFHTRARQRQDNDKTKVEPVHFYYAFHTRFVGPGVKGTDKPGVKGIIEMHRFNICLVVVLSLSCSGVKAPLDL